MAALQGLDPESSISTFEFLTSGVVTRLKAYLQGASTVSVLGRGLRAGKLSASSIDEFCGCVLRFGHA